MQKMRAILNRWFLNLTEKKSWSREKQRAGLSSLKERPATQEREKLGSGSMFCGATSKEVN
jgi:hypothetical protein